MATATLLVTPNWSGSTGGVPIDPVPPNDDINGIDGFWQVAANTTGSVEGDGSTDLGACLQAPDDGLTIVCQNDGASGISLGSALYFNDAGDVPLDAGIVSVQLVAKFAADRVDLSSAVFMQWGTTAQVVLNGADSNNFTGDGTFSSDVMTINPSTGVAWVFDDLYGAALPFSDPKGLQGWWGFMNLAPGSGDGSPGTETFVFDYVALIVEYGDVDVTPTNWKMDAAFVTGGKGSREFGVRRVT